MRTWMRGIGASASRRNGRHEGTRLGRLGPTATAATEAATGGRAEERVDDRKGAAARGVGVAAATIPCYWRMIPSARPLAVLGSPLRVAAASPGSEEASTATVPAQFRVAARVGDRRRAGPSPHLLPPPAR